MAGTLEEREALGRQFFDGVMSFEPLVTHYSRIRPDVAFLGHLLDGDEVRLVDQKKFMPS